MTVSEGEWPPPPSNLILTSDEIHVWRVSLEPSPTYVQQLKQTLSPDEQRRAARFHFEKDRRHFIVARGVLRAMLGRYLGLEPTSLQFTYNPQGKPALAEPCQIGKGRLQFNLSHAHELALYAITYERDLGIDLEYMHRRMTDTRVAERFFSPPEVESLRALLAAQQREAFFNCWTRKEAYIKARGDGLSLPLDQFDVSLTPGQPATLLSTRHDPQAVKHWSLQALSPGPRYVGALAVAGHGWRLHCWQWPPM